MLCVTNCAGTPHKSGVWDVGLTVLEFCNLESILWAVLHQNGTSERYEVVWKLPDSVNIGITCAGVKIHVDFYFF